jgi:hypothetical protein
MCRREEDSIDARIQVYKVVRADEYSSGTDAITIKEILSTIGSQNDRLKD